METRDSGILKKILASFQLFPLLSVFKGFGIMFIYCKMGV